MFHNWNDGKTSHMTAVSVHLSISTDPHTCWPCMHCCSGWNNPKHKKWMILCVYHTNWEYSVLFTTWHDPPQMVWPVPATVGHWNLVYSLRITKLNKFLKEGSNGIRHKQTISYICFDTSRLSNFQITKQFAPLPQNTVKSVFSSYTVIVEGSNTYQLLLPPALQAEHYNICVGVGVASVNLGVKIWSKHTIIAILLNGNAHTMLG